jgi:hypothetical protein
VSWLCALAASLLGASALPPPSGLERAAQSAAQRFAAAIASAPRETAVGVAVSSPDAPELARAAQSALLAQLSRMGFKAALAIAAGPEAAEAEARARGLDWLLRAAARVDGSEIALAGDALPTWVNFWAGADPVRAEGGGAIAARAVADADVLTLARRPLTPRPSPATPFGLRLLARLPERVVAVAVGDLDGDGRGEIALQLPAAVVVLRPDGERLARRDQGGLGRAARPPREPAGALAALGCEPAARPALATGGRQPGPERPCLASFSFGLAKGELLRLEGGELTPVQALDAPALAAGAAGAISGAALPGRNLFAPEVRLASGKGATLPFAPISVAASSRSAGPAFLAIATDGAALLLSEELEPLEAALPPLGAGAAMGDFDGGGVAELVTTGRVRAEDRARLWRADDWSEGPLFESEPVPGGFVAGAAGDLDGQGRDEAVLVAWNPDGGSAVYALRAQR